MIESARSGQTWPLAAAHESDDLENVARLHLHQGSLITPDDLPVSFDRDAVDGEVQLDQKTFNRSTRRALPRDAVDDDR